MNYQEATAYIEEIRGRLASDYSLDRVMKLAGLMGHPERKLRIVHIAGTNGKGSVGAYIANALAMSGYSVGRFASPALFDPREQIQRVLGNHFGTDTAWISEEEVAERITQIAQCVRKWNRWEEKAQRHLRLRRLWHLSRWYAGIRMLP